MVQLQAAQDVLGVAMGPTVLVQADIVAGRLVTPFPDITLPTRSYYAYVPEARRSQASALYAGWRRKVLDLALPLRPRLIEASEACRSKSMTIRG
ncbi:hypothetical protein CIW50_27315 [Tardiphaga sp. P9-11]|nr:hypothetical protein CIW50_27315 [Tardiphaga sp. P9-11]